MVQGTWFEKSNLTLEEILKFTYQWTVGLKESQIAQQLRLSQNTAIDWYMFCRDVCEVAIQPRNPRNSQEQVNRRIQNRQTQLPSRSLRRGTMGIWRHRRGQQKIIYCSRSRQIRKNLLPLIKKWIQSSSIIVSDCWKAYINLDKYGYTHETVNHFQEFVNDEDAHNNKIEGHWRQLKASLPTHGRRKHHYSVVFRRIHLEIQSQRRRFILDFSRRCKILIPL